MLSGMRSDWLAICEIHFTEPQVAFMNILLRVALTRNRIIVLQEVRALDCRRYRLQPQRRIPSPYLIPDR